MAVRKVVVVGVGALGSHFLLCARNFEDVAWKLVDFDRIERKNLASQFHTVQGVGKNKAEALRQAMSLFGMLKLEAVPHRLTGDNADAILRGASLVVDCLDNGASRRIVQAYVRGHGIPCLHGAVDAAGTYGRVVWDERFEIDDETVVGQATCEGGEHLPFIVTVASQIALAARRFLADGRKTGSEINPAGVYGT